MEGLVVIIIILVVVSNLRRQAGSRNRSGNATPYKPVQRAGGDDAPAQSAQAEGTPTEGIPARPVRKPFAPRPLTPVAPMGPMRPASSAQPVDPAHPARPGTPATARREETMLPERPARREETMLPEQPARAQSGPELCDDGYGSLEHTRHEGDEFHAPGTHGGMGRRPGELAARGAQAVAPASDEAVPELLGLELDADTMRRAVVFSEIINKRGGRHGWVKI